MKKTISTLSLLTGIILCTTTESMVAVLIGAVALIAGCYGLGLIHTNEEDHA